MNQCPNCKSETTTLIREYSNGKLLRTYCWNCGAQGMPDSIESKHRAKPLEDGIIQWLREHDVPLTLANYVAVAYGCTPEELEGELMATLPDELIDGPKRVTINEQCFECKKFTEHEGLCDSCAAELLAEADFALRNIKTRDDAKWLKSIGVKF